MEKRPFRLIIAQSLSRTSRKQEGMLHMKRASSLRRQSLAEGSGIVLPAEGAYQGKETLEPVLSCTSCHEGHDVFHPGSRIWNKPCRCIKRGLTVPEYWKIQGWSWVVGRRKVNYIKFWLPMWFSHGLMFSGVTGLSRSCTVALPLCSRK